MVSSHQSACLKSALKLKMFTICRLCLKNVDDSECVAIASNEDSDVLQKIRLCLPEIDMALIIKSLVCNVCLDILNNLADFKHHCMQSQQLIVTYMKCIDPHGYVKSVDTLSSNLEVFRCLYGSIESIANKNTVLGSGVSPETYECLHNISAIKVEKSDTENSAIKYATLEYALEPNMDMETALCEIKPEKTMSKFDRSCRTPSPVFVVWDTIENEIAESPSQQTNTDSDAKFFSPRIKIERGSLALKSADSRSDEERQVNLDECQDLSHTTYKDGARKNGIIDNNSSKEEDAKEEVSKKNTLAGQDKQLQYDSYSSYKSDVCSQMKTYIKERPFECHICQCRFKRENILTQHIMIHSSKKRFNCNLCHFRSVTKSNLDIHTRIHTGEKPYQCDICNYRSSRKAHLKVHMATHTGEKHFMCYMCNYKSLRKRDFKQHLASHKGEKPFQCDVCGFRSLLKKNIMQHALRHDSKKPFMCKTCSIGFMYKSSLNRHIGRHLTEIKSKPEGDGVFRVI